MTQPLKVNLSSEEAGSQVREVPPTGTYTVNITDGKHKTVKPGRKNVGKPFWQLTLVIQDGQYRGTSLLSSIMLFDGALYSFSQLMKSLDYNVQSGDFTIPPLEELFGRTVKVVGQKMPPKTQDDGSDLPERFEVKGFKRANVNDTQTKASSSMLP